jgi:MarR family transcriptional regulator, organic hydroperoxide resistance regulator
MRANEGPKSGSSAGSRDNSRDTSRGNQKPKPPTGERRLGDFLCFAIYSANLAFGRAYRKGLEDLGLTYPQWIAIVALWEQDDQTVSELGEKMFLESNTLTPVLKKLETMGYLRRQRDPADERQVRVSLTDEGRLLREKGMHMNLVASTGLKPDEFVRLQETVVTLRDNLIKATAEKA